MAIILPERTRDGDFWFTSGETHAYQIALLDMQASIAAELREMSVDTMAGVRYTSLEAVIARNAQRATFQKEIKALVLTIIEAHKAPPPPATKAPKKVRK
jgi:hypothetical protein